MIKRSIDLEILGSLLKDILERIREFSGCQSVAIRLYKEGDFPYYSHIGFPEVFIRKETLPSSNACVAMYSRAGSIRNIHTSPKMEPSGLTAQLDSLKV